MRREAVALGVLAWVVGLAAIAGTWGVAGWTGNVIRTLPRWNEMPERLGVSPVESGLLGVILFLLAVLTWVLARGPYAPETREREAREARMVQELYRGLASVEERLELLETLVVQRAGRLSFGRKTN